MGGLIILPLIFIKKYYIIYIENQERVGKFMNIYFDFEATQYSDHIIAIGASSFIASDYQNFFCLVSSFADKMTPFITELTGITKEDLLMNGIEVDEAFVKLWHWIRHITNMSDEPIFYHCYGEGDKNFLRKTADKIKDRYVAEFVNNLAESLIDDSKAVCRYFHTKAVGVFKALRYSIASILFGCVMR